MVLRRFTNAQCFGLAWAISLAISAVAATASPRKPSELSIKAASEPVSAHLRGAQSARYRMLGNRPRARYRSGEHTVAQISPAIWRRSDVFLEDEAPPPCPMNARRRSACRAAFLPQQGLPDVLLEAPTPATERSLRELGIPAIKDVPPIAILRARPLGEDDNSDASSR
jgi:hypothetical protein